MCRNVLFYNKFYFQEVSVYSEVKIKFVQLIGQWHNYFSSSIAYYAELYVSYCQGNGFGYTHSHIPFSKALGLQPYDGHLVSTQ